MKPIPRLGKKGISFKSIGVEVLIGLGIGVILFNRLILTNTHELLQLPAILVIIVIAIVLLSPSSSNEGRTTMYGIMKFLKFRFDKAERETKTDRSSRFMLKIKNLLNRGEVKVKKNIVKQSNKINISSLEDAGILQVTEDTYIDKNNIELAVFQYEYKDMVGINSEIDQQNHEAQSKLFDALSGNGKLTFPYRSNTLLNETYAFFLDELEITEYDEEIEEMLDYIAHYRRKEHAEKVLEIEISDITNLQINSDHLHIERLSGEDLINYLHKKQFGGKKQ